MGEQSRVDRSEGNEQSRSERNGVKASGEKRGGSGWRKNIGSE